MPSGLLARVLPLNLHQWRFTSLSGMNWMCWRKRRLNWNWIWAIRQTGSTQRKMTGKLDSCRAMMRKFLTCEISAKKNKKSARTWILKLVGKSVEKSQKPIARQSAFYSIAVLVCNFRFFRWKRKSGNKKESLLEATILQWNIIKATRRNWFWKVDWTRYWSNDFALQTEWICDNHISQNFLSTLACFLFHFTCRTETESLQQTPLTKQGPERGNRSSSEREKHFWRPVQTVGEEAWIFETWNAGCHSTSHFVLWKQVRSDFFFLSQTEHLSTSFSTNRHIPMINVTDPLVLLVCQDLPTFEQVSFEFCSEKEMKRRTRWQLCRREMKKTS